MSKLRKLVRFYYLEAFRLEESFENTARQVALYLLSFITSYEELLEKNTPSPEESSKWKVFVEKMVDESLSHTIRNSPESIWEGMLSMFLCNNNISARVIPKLYKEHKEKSLDYLNSFGFSTSASITLEEYTKLWKQIAEKRYQDYRRWFTSLQVILNSENLENLTDFLKDEQKELKKNWLSSLDTLRLNTVFNELLETLITYINSSSYREKERNYNFVTIQIDELIKEIQEKPTKFSYEGFLPLLEKIEQLLKKSFQIVQEASTPKIKLSILRESVALNNQSIVPFQVILENSKDSAPTQKVRVTILNDEDIQFIEEENFYNDSIDGGENCIFKLKVKVSNAVLKNKAATLNVVCEYKIQNQSEPIQISEQLSLRLYSEEEFQALDNPYASLADGGPVENEKMFYGRDEFIESRIQALLNSDSKQIIIYGQKRSGKSSVLNHLNSRVMMRRF
ncbi:MAG: ATP-binding protein [Leptospiraceae bacterium]|nr:ATP-binding protein [Leptospiraceae bacterium]